MSDILCIYYSRTGNTKKAMEEIAAALDAELAELRRENERLKERVEEWKGQTRRTAPGTVDRKAVDRA